MASASPSQSGVKSAMRTLDLIEYVVARPSGVVAQEIAAGLAIPVSSLSYLLGTLVERDYLRRDGRRYFAGEGLDRLRRPQEDLTLAEKVGPLLKALVQQVNETATFFEMKGFEVESVVTEIARHPLRYAIETGTRTPLHCVASGKAILATYSTRELDRYLEHSPLVPVTDFTITDRSTLEAQLEDVRRTGIAYTRDEYTVGISSIGSAVIIGGKAMSAIGVACPSARYSAQMEERVVEHLRATVKALEANCA